MIKENLERIIIILVMIPFFTGGIIIWIKMLRKWCVLKDPPKPPSVFSTPMVYWSEYIKNRLGARERICHRTSVCLKSTFGYFWTILLAMGLSFIVISIFLTLFNGKGDFDYGIKKRGRATDRNRNNHKLMYKTVNTKRMTNELCKLPHMMK